MLPDFIFNANTLVGIGAVIASLAYGFTTIFGGYGKGNKALALLYKEQLEAQKEINKDLQNQVNTMRQEVGKLQGLYEGNEKKLKEYLQLFGPAGELKSTLTRLEESANSNAEISAAAVQFMNDARSGKIGLDLKVK